MPREQINYPRVKELPDGSSEVADGILAQVAWTRDAENVQVGLMLTTARLKEIVDYSLKEGLHETSIYSDSLTRWEANKAIRALRTARDVAHGKDA